ncbi:MAG TPA: DNA polymerase III subunit gamma/tau [Lachnospiraceae bacterium]|nr:DNA polymerase III subunit gamma/tau [Lachnospiraceae bacterium]
MSYVALYRKFRPSTFDEVKGQDHIVKTLKNQMKTDRLGHAYLFCGTRGTGKTSVAKILAKAVNCEHPVDGSPCNECPACRAIQAGASMNVIEIDAASNNGVDNIREIREEVAYRPTEGRFKVYIIDEVHMLSAGAFNALLKTLEEPPSYVIFILATTEVNKIPITILSRCQRYDFHRISIDTIAARLRELLEQEGVEAEEKALRYVAKAGDGSMRDALSLLDQCIAFYYGEVLTYERALETLGAADFEVFSRMLRDILEQEVSSCIRRLEEMIYRGKELTQFVGDFTWYLRNLLLLKTGGDGGETLDVSAENLRLLEEESSRVDEETLMRYIRILSELSNRIRYSTQKRVEVEVALIRMCRPQMETDVTSLLDRVRELEKKVEKGLVAAAAEYRQTPARREAAPREEAPPVAKATPEDLAQIAVRWREIIRQCGPLLRALLDTAVPQYNAKTGENVLYLSINTPQGGCGLSGKQIVELQDVIERTLGKRVEVKEMKNQSQSASMRELEVQAAVAREVAIPVEIETDIEE